jgi:CelD/BcsL family acetyltransferase involved in cellulose biosynthesis
MNYKLISNFDDFLSLKKPWNELVSTTEVDHAFMKHEWFECWIKNLGQDGKLTIQTAWQDNILVGIAPLHIVRKKRKGIPLRLLSFLHSSITPRCNFILHDSVDRRSFFDSLFKIKGWDIMELRSLEIGKKITEDFIEYLKSTRQYVLEDGIQSPYEILNMDWKTFQDTRFKDYRRNLNNCANRVKKAESFEVVKLQKSAEFQRHFDDLISISSRSWKVKEGTDLVSDSKMASFYRDFSFIGSTQNLCMASLLFINEKPVAFDYYLRFGTSLVATRWEYDEEYSYYNPGYFLHAHIIKELIESDEKWEFDLSGDLTEFKSRLAKQIRKHLMITTGRNNLYGRLLMSFKKALMKTNKMEHSITVHDFNDNDHSQG